MCTVPAGTFGPEQVIPITAPTSVAAGDFNGDGLMDLVTAGGPDVTVLINNGDGTFAKTTYAAGGAYGVTVADLNGDGRLDFATAGFGIAAVSVHLNNGDGTFAPHVEYPNVKAAVGITAADIDGDGDLDLLTAVYNGDKLSVMLNAGDGTFGLPTQYDTGKAPFGVAVADFDNDGDLDAVVSNQDDDTMGIFANDGTGAFGPQVTFALPGPQTIVAIDLDGDGFKDLVVASVDDVAAPAAWVAINDKAGGFLSPTPYPVASRAAGHAVGDLDGDGKVDIVVASLAKASVSVLLGNGDGTFGAQTEVPITVSDAAVAGSIAGWSVAVADLDQDGRADIAVADRGDATLSVLRNSCQ